MLPGLVDVVAQRNKGDALYGGSMQYMLTLGSRPAQLDGMQDDAPEFAVVLDTSTGDIGTTRIQSFVPISRDALLDVAIKPRS